MLYTGDAFIFLLPLLMNKAFRTTLCAIFFITQGSLVQASFSDVPANHPHFTAIDYVETQDIVSGYPDGTYKPEQFVNRAEFVKILVGASLKYNPGQDPSGFDIYALVGITLTDVPHGEWYVPYLRKALQNDIIAGYPDLTFRGTNRINKVEAAKIVATSFGLEILPESFNENWFDGYIYALEQKNAFPSSLVCFDQHVTRGELAEMIYRLKTNATLFSSTSSYLKTESKLQFSLNETSRAKCDARGFLLTGNAVFPTGTDPKTVTLDDSDVNNGSTMYDFDTEQRTNKDVTPDMTLSGMFYEDNWMRGVSWMVVPMEGTFEEISQCPAQGYANVYDVGPDGFGTPYNAWQGDLYCLQTSEKNYVLLEVLSSYNESENRFLTIRYVINKTGGTQVR